eukprot:Platyproteum_vivax@DN4411_c0_g1_i3.p1
MFAEIVPDTSGRTGEAFPGHMLNVWMAEKEQDAYLKFNSTRPIHYKVINEDEKILGNSRGFLIFTEKTIYPVNPSGALYQGSASWAKYNIASTIRKESELDGSIPVDATDVGNAIIDFEEFLSDNEPVRRQDIVTWISCGIWHIPHLEDIPHTVALGMPVGFTVKPHNYFSKDPLYDLHNSWDAGKPLNDPGVCGIMREGESLAFFR